MSRYQYLESSLDRRSEFPSIRRRRLAASVISPENSIDRTAVLADNTADFIYGPRLLLSCDLTGSTRRHPHTLDIPGINERKRGECVQV